MNTLKMDQPIGIFDSGIGGLTVASAISKLLPKERLIYFGDTAHLPYGDKSPDSIRRYSLAIAKFLESRHCKVILIACNTASAHAYLTLTKEYGQRLIVMDVINPVAQYIADNYQGKKVGVIATKGTVKSNIYKRRIKKINPAVTVSTLATPLLAPMIEEGFFNNNISRAVVSSYLSKKSLHDIHALVLGCTHYPLIRKEVEHFFDNHLNGRTCAIIDSAECTAYYLKNSLEEHAILSDKKNGVHEFFVSDYTDSFANCTKLFFGDKVNLQESGLWRMIDSNPNISDGSLT